MAKSLRVVRPITLVEAVESGDVLAILQAQRRIIAAALVDAAENTKPQFSNELSKLTRLIVEEEERLEAVEREANADRSAATAEDWDAEAI